MTAVPAAEQQQQQHHHHHQPARGVTGDDTSSSAELERASATAVHVQQASSDEKDKIARILSACRDRDLEALCELACSEKGLVDDEVRRTACKFLSRASSMLQLRNNRSHSCQGQFYWASTAATSKSLRIGTGTTCPVIEMKTKFGWTSTDHLCIILKVRNYIFQPRQLRANIV